MLDDKDIQKLKEVLATKEDFSVLLVKFDTTKKELKEDLNGLREMVQALVMSVDKLVGAIDDLKQEYAMVTLKVDAMKSGYIKLLKNSV